MFSGHVRFHEHFFPFTDKNGRFMFSSAPNNMCTSPPFFLPFRCDSFPSDDCVPLPYYHRTSVDALVTMSSSITSPPCSSPDQTVVHSVSPSHIAEPAQPSYGDHSFHSDTIIRYVPSTSNDLFESTRYISNPSTEPQVPLIHPFILSFTYTYDICSLF